MKKNLLVLLITVVSIQFANAQWTTTGNNISNSNTGKVGIGTTNLFTPFTVELGSAAGVNQGLAINSSHGYGTGQGTAGSGLVFSRNRATDQSAIQAEAQIVGGNVNETTSQGGYLGFYTNNSSNTLTEALHIDAFQKIGIGTASPANNLQIMTSTSSTIGLSGTAGNIRDYLFQTGGISRWALRADGTSETGSNIGSDFDIIGRDDTGALLGTYLFIKRSNGNVGIGTTNPYNYKLAVNGDVIATSMTVKLNSDWPDYVFKQDYKLKSLNEVKIFIDQNHRLPDMPSAEEVVKNGLNLGETNKVLTKKVEELTLYLIEKDKQMTELQNQLINLAKQVKKVQSPKTRTN